MNSAQIENNLQKLVKSFVKETFIYDLLLAYGLPKANITRLQKGNLNLSKTEGEICWKKKVLFRPVYNEDLHIAISQMAKEIKHEQRFVIATNFETLLAIDTKTKDKLDISITDLPRHYDFFLPWAGMEKHQDKKENIADVKAAEKMAKLFDEIKKDNPDNSPAFIHGLNVFLSRLLFCFFAEDTNIFKKGQFTGAISSHTQADGSDLNSYLDKLFTVLNTPDKQRKDLPAYLMEFPYVNGGLFKLPFPSPVFTRKSRQAIIDAGDMGWNEINPDIFGSMFQAVIGADQRGNLGQHYTSVPNIMKVIEPLFLNDLYEAYEKAKGNNTKISELLRRLSKIKIFDPACGSGNFLIIAYKELRRLEMKIFKETGLMALSGISLSQFYGIELDDFAHEIAQLSLWLAEHQMNTEFFNEFGKTNPTLPLKEAGNIVQGNACRLDWEEVCPKKPDDEVYILGNPPYLGARNQDAIQKMDIEFVLNCVEGANNLDYISCWFFLAAKFCLKNQSRAAFVTTNSICQGSQVPVLWNPIFDMGIEIEFIHQAFKWANNAKNSAGVICVIIGIGQKSKKVKKIYNENSSLNVWNISPYLILGSNTIVLNRSEVLSSLPRMIFGSMPNDNGHLILEDSDKEVILTKYPHLKCIIKKFVGSSEFIRGNLRYCLWLEDSDLKTVLGIPEVSKKILAVKEARLISKRPATNKLATIPHKFAEIRHLPGASIIVPSVSSERRDYIPMGFLDDNTVISNLALAIYNAEPWMLGLLTSNIHMVWVKSIGGYLGTSIRYSISVCYNTFPFPPISDQRKQEITQCVFRILAEREKHSEKTLAELYDPDKMPEGLREAHRQNDLAIERCYRSKPFESDEERLEYLFKLYEKMIAEEKEKNTLFEKEKKAKKKLKND